MARKILLLVLLLSLLSQVFCLQCNTCHGEYNCVGEKMTCEGSSASCTTSVRKAHVSFLEFQTVRKGCARQLYPFGSFSLTSHLVTLSYQANFCAEDGCNNETYFVSHPAPANHMRCHTCASQGAWCPEASRTEISCVGHQDQCVDLDITGKMGPYTNLKLKGCTNLPRCEDTLSFYSGDRTVHASCCNTPLCNAFTPGLHVESQAPNGLECYSCVDGQGSGAGCSGKTISKVKCTGVRDMCLEGTGNSRKAGKRASLVTFKGCASPAMCQSSLLELVQELEDADILCCQGNLCNNRIVDGVITEPRVAADSPEGIEDVNCPVFNLKPSEPVQKPDYLYSDELEENDMVAVNSPAGEVPPPGNRTDKETVYAADEMKASGSFVNESDARPSSHHSHNFVGGKPYEENLSGNSSESRETSSSTHAKLGPSGSSSAMSNLERSNSTPSGNHGNVVLLIPFIVPKRNKTTSPTTSSPIKTSVSEEVFLASSNDNDVASDGCEMGEKCLAPGGGFIATSERDGEGSPSSHPASLFPVNISSSAEDALNPGSFLRGESHENSESYSSSIENTYNASLLAVEEHGLPHSPATNVSESTNVHRGRETTGGEYFVVDKSIPVSNPASRNATSDGLASHVLPRFPIASADNGSSIAEGKTQADASAAANTNMFNSINGSGMGLFAAPRTPRPITKTPASRNATSYGLASHVLPRLPIASADNGSSIVEGKTEADASAAANTNMFNSINGSGMGLFVAASTSRPQTKTPCGHPECQNPPKMNLMTGTGTEEEAAKKGSTSFHSDPKNPERNTAGKEKSSNGALGLTTNLGFCSLALLLAVLT